MDPMSLPQTENWPRTRPINNGMRRVYTNRARRRRREKRNATKSGSKRNKKRGRGERKSYGVMVGGMTT